MMRKILFGIGLVVFASLGFGSVAGAAQSVPYRLNFQGSLTDGSSNTKADGQYNMRFRLYSAEAGGTAVWTETRDVAGGNGVTLSKGLFNVQLGGITPISPSLFASQPLYLEVELPTPGTATSSSPSWSEGPMTPRQLMASHAYAMNADTIDGIDGASLAQLSANQTFSGNNSFTGTVLQQATSSTAFRVQSAGGADALVVDTSNLAVKVGGGDVSPGASPALLVLDYKSTAGDPTGTNGGMYYNAATKKIRCYESDGWNDCIPESKAGFRSYTDFMTGGTFVSGSPFNNTTRLAYTGVASATRLNGELDHPGIVRMSIGSTAAQVAIAIGSNFNTDNLTNSVRFGGAAWSTTTQVRLNTIPNASNYFLAFNGFFDNMNQLYSGGLINGCLVLYLQTSATNWRGHCESNNTASGCDPIDIASPPGSPQVIAPVDTTKWYTLTTAVNASATLATFVVEGNGQTGVCTVSSNIPTTTLAFGTALQRVSGTVSGSQDIDYIEVKTSGLVRN